MAITEANEVYSPASLPNSHFTHVDSRDQQPRVAVGIAMARLITATTETAIVEKPAEEAEHAVTTTAALTRQEHEGPG